MADLPPNVFEYIAPKELIESTTIVCKSWNSVVDNNNLWKYHVPWGNHETNLKKEYLDVFRETEAWINTIQENNIYEMQRLCSHRINMHKALLVNDEQNIPKLYGVSKVNYMTAYDISHLNHSGEFPYHEIYPGDGHSFLYDIDNFGYLIACCGTGPQLDIIDVNKPEEQETVASLKYPEYFFSKKYRNALSIKFSPDGQYLFVTVEDKCGPDGAILMYDVEKGVVVQQFQHPQRVECKKIVTYEKQHLHDDITYKYAMRALCPHSNNNQFFSASYTDVFQWDIRSGQITKTLPFLTDDQVQHREYGVDNITIQLINNETELLVNNALPVKTVTYSSNNLVPTHSQFPSNFFTIYVDNFKGFGFREDKKPCLIDCVNKEETEIKDIEDEINAGAVFSCHLNQSGDTIALLNGDEDVIIWSTLDLWKE